jgi:hypothetical protein
MWLDAYSSRASPCAKMMGDERLKVFWISTTESV